MKPDASFTDKFEGWFVAPIEKLKELPEGDGGFLILSAALFLCERYYRTLTNTHEREGSNTEFKIKAAEDLGLSFDDFNCFWTVYRHGIQHQGMPKFYVDKKNVEYSWLTSSSFNAIPEICDIDVNKREIRLDPWKFADLIITKYRANPAVLQDATSHAFGSVRYI